MVGVGSGLITANMPGGIHVRLVADFDYRARTLARLLDVPLNTAAAEVRRRDTARAAFHRRFFPDTALTPERFTVTLNASMLTEAQMVASLIPLLRNALKTEDGFSTRLTSFPLSMSGKDVEWAPQPSQSG